MTRRSGTLLRLARDRRDRNLLSFADIEHLTDSQMQLAEVAILGGLSIALSPAFSPHKSPTKSAFPTDGLSAMVGRTARRADGHGMSQRKERRWQPAIRPGAAGMRQLG